MTAIINLVTSRWLMAIAVFVWLGGGAAMIKVLEASQVHFRPLEEVVRDRTLVIAVVEVTDVEWVETYVGPVAYDFKVLRWLTTDRLPSSITRASYVFPMPKFFERDGKKLWISPLVAASGIESRVEPGPYLFFFSPEVQKDIGNVIRIELASREGEVRALLADVVSLESTSQPEGDLELYPTMTEIGTAAKRTVRDANGRVTKIISYTLKPGEAMTGRGPFREEQLAVQSIRRFDYDEQGRKRRIEQYAPDMTLRSVQEYQYGKDGTVSFVVSDGNGIKRFETETINGRTVSQLVFDRRGERIVAVSGLIPRRADVGLAWGEALDGLACGIAPSARDLPSDHVEVYLTIRNDRSTPANIPLLPWDSTITLELRDAAGALVPQDTVRLQDRLNRLQDPRSNPLKLEPIVPPGEATYYPFSLENWYGQLSSGQYELTVTYHPVKEGVSLACPPVTVHVREATE